MKRPHGKFIPSVNHLTAFDAVARMGSITAAARVLSLTQSAVSKQIADLQTFVDVSLFERRDGKLVPTRCGEQYLSRVQPALAELESATLEVMATRGAGGHLNLSVPATFGAMWLLPRLNQFAASAPHIVINLSTKIGTVALPAPDVDAAIMYVAGAVADDLWCQPILPLTVLPVCSPALVHKRAAPATLLATLPLLHQGSMPDAWTSYCASRGQGTLTARAGPRYALLSMGLHAARAGLGIALLPPYVVADAVTRGELVVLDDTAHPQPGAYAFVCGRQSRDAPAISAFSAWLQTQVSPPVTS